MYFLNLFLALTMALPGYDFLTVPRSPRDPNAADVGIDAFHKNPAGLALSPNGVYAYQSFWFVDSKMTYLGASIKKWGVRVSYFDFGKIEYQDEVPNDDEGAFFHPYAIEMALDRGFKLDPELSVGVGLAFFSEKIYRYDVQNFTLEGGIRYAPRKVKGLSVGFSFRYLGLKAGVRNEDFKMPTQGIFSVNYTRGNLGLSYSAEKIFTYETLEDTFTGTLSSVRNSLKDIAWIIDPGLRLGVTHSIKISYSFPYGIGAHVAYFQGADITPFSAGVSYQVRNFFVTYCYRVARRGFDSPHLIGLVTTFP